MDVPQLTSQTKLVHLAGCVGDKAFVAGYQKSIGILTNLPFPYDLSEYG